MTTIQVHTESDKLVSISVADAAILLGLTYRTVHEWTKDADDPLPLVYKSTGRGGKGGANRVSLPDLLEWRERRAVTKALLEYADDEDDEDLDEDDGDEDAETGGSRKKNGRYSYEKSKAKRMHHQANTAELIELRATRAVLPVDLMIGEVDEDAVAFKAAVMNLPGRLAHRVATLSDTRDCYNAIREECVDTLSTIRSGFLIAKAVDEQVKREQEDGS